MYRVTPFLLEFVTFALYVLQHHLKMKHSPFVDGQYKCLYCKYKTKTKDEFTSHMESHEDESDETETISDNHESHNNNDNSVHSSDGELGENVCPTDTDVKNIADKATVESLYKPPKKKRPPPDAYSKDLCTSCDMYVLSGTLNLHKSVCLREVVSNKEDGILPCSNCGLTFASLRTLTAHQRNMHSVGGTPSSYAGHNRRWACDLCSKTFQGRMKLLHHRFMAHGDNRERFPVLPCPVGPFAVFNTKTFYCYTRL